MPAEYRYVDGSLRPGYFCSHCGQPAGGQLGHLFLSSEKKYAPWGQQKEVFYRDHPPIGNDEWICKANPTLVEQLRRANPPPGTKPHYVLKEESKIPLDVLSFNRLTGKHGGYRYVNRGGPRPLSLCKLVRPEQYSDFHPTAKFIFLGEIPNMLGHCIIFGFHDRKLYTCFHTHDFVELTDEEV